MNGTLMAAMWGALGGWLAWKARIPGGAVVGAMLATALFAFTRSERMAFPGWLEVVLQIGVGIMIGLSADRSMLPLLKTVLPLALLGALGFLLFGFTLAAISVHFGWLDAATAMFGFTPGGISVMSVVAAEEGGRPAVVATMHFVRVVTLLLGAPLVVRWWLGLQSGG